MENALLYVLSRRAFIAGLACYHLHRVTRDPLWLERGKARKEKMKHNSEEGCKQNFEHMYLLMQAEESGCNGDYTISKCQDHRSYMDGA
jgi:hypothetical protein